MNRVEVYLKAKETMERLAKSQKVDINKYYIPASPETLRKNLAEKGVYITNPSTSIDLPVLFYLFCGHLADSLCQIQLDFTQKAIMTLSAYWVKYLETITQFMLPNLEMLKQ